MHNPTPAFLNARSVPRHKHQRLFQQSSTPSALEMVDAKLDAPSAQRNKEVIWDVLSTKAFPNLVRPQDNENDNDSTTSSSPPIYILEVAAGSGVHTEHFATRLASLLEHNNNKRSFVWYTGDAQDDYRASLSRYIEDSQLDAIGVYKSPLPLTLDETGIIESSTATTVVGQPQQRKLDVMICINMIHISPWQATLGLMKLAGEQLTSDGILYCYGPYKEGGMAVESNLNFDRSLKSRDPGWGVRELDDVLQAASAQGLELVERIEMPANNLSVLFRRRS